MTRFALSIVDNDELPGVAARTLADAISDAVTQRGHCSFAVSRPPQQAFEILAASDVDWSAGDIFQVDERAAPDADPERNLTLIEHVFGEALKAARMHPMPVSEDQLEAAARRYAGELEASCGSPPVLDVVHLGLGPDGHTASLLPGDPVLEVRDRWVAVTREAAGYRRMTLTYPLLDVARLVVFVVSGAQKSTALRQVLSGDRTMPAARINADDVRVLADRDAASLM